MYHIPGAIYEVNAYRVTLPQEEAQDMDADELMYEALENDRETLLGTEDLEKAQGLLDQCKSRVYNHQDENGRGMTTGCFYILEQVWEEYGTQFEEVATATAFDER